MAWREGLDRVLQELLQTQELYRAAEAQQQSLKLAIERHKEDLLQSLVGENSPAVAVALGEQLAPLGPTAKKDAVGQEGKEFLGNSAMAALAVTNQPMMPEGMDSDPPMYPPSSEMLQVNGEHERSIDFYAAVNGTSTEVIQTVQEEQTQQGEDDWTKFAKDRPRPSDRSSKRKSSEGGKRNSGDSDIMDSWAAAEMMGITGEDKIMGKFDTIIGVMVLANALCMAINLECQGAQSALSLGMTGGMVWCELKPALQVLEHFFAIVFGLELIYRLYCIRCDYFKDYWNWLDFTLVFIAVTDLYIMDPLLSETPAHNATTLRVFRVVKLARVIRIARALRLFRGLRVLVHACSSFLPSLTWSMALLGLCMLSSGLLIGNLLQDFIVDETQDLETREWMWQHYGTSYRAIYTMYEMTFAGNWGIYARPVLEHVSHFFVIFYIVYITFIVFAVIRVITAIFLRETLEAANNDAELMVQEGLRRKATYIHKLESIFNAIDESQDGLIDEEEMNELFMDTRVTTYLETLDIDVMQSSALFHLLANGDGQITCSDFIDGILRCKGPARAIDQIMMQKDIRRVETQVKTLTDALENADVIAKRPSRASFNRHTRRSMIDAEITLLGTAKMGDSLRYAP